MGISIKLYGLEPRQTHVKILCRRGKKIDRENGGPQLHKQMMKTFVCTHWITWKHKTSKFHIIEEMATLQIFAHFAWNWLWKQQSDVKSKRTVVVLWNFFCFFPRTCVTQMITICIHPIVKQCTPPLECTLLIYCNHTETIPP